MVQRPRGLIFLSARRDQTSNWPQKRARLQEQIGPVGEALAPPREAAPQSARRVMELLQTEADFDAPGAARQKHRAHYFNVVLKRVSESLPQIVRWGGSVSNLPRRNDGKTASFPNIFLHLETDARVP